MLLLVRCTNVAVFAILIQSLSEPAPFSYFVPLYNAFDVNPNGIKNGDE